MQNTFFQDFNIIGSYIGQYLQKYKSLLKLDSTVLITGETGTGKELIARWIHFMDETRKNSPFVKITIPNIGENIFESEVFGYEKGAFTGAISSKKGLIEVAENGTIFLDEIENASPSIQSKLLQLLEDRIYRKVGGTEYMSTEARFIIATNVDLYDEVKQGRFRSDLYYRLAVLDINLPALREREGDVIEIANYYIEKLNDKFGKSIKLLENTNSKELLEYKWSGNIRELRNFIEKQMVFAESEELDLSELKRRGTAHSLNPGSYKQYMDRVEKEYIKKMYKQKNNKVEEVAQAIEMSVPFVYKKLKEHGIS
ncbi:MAG: two-component system, NtrC family, response regulator [Clostridia bacterium]|jgi:transcriptional regulator with PAS, ATPase and Fis domain|nr:two-component system, NtrC family, response regulator [Clostridia bacterium]